MEMKKVKIRWSRSHTNEKSATRKLESELMQNLLGRYQYKRILELGCGIGSNTKFLINHCEMITSIDRSKKKLDLARSSIKSHRIRFRRLDIQDEWKFVQERYDLITISLIFETIQDIDAIFAKIARVASADAMIYIGERHPYKLYANQEASQEFDQELFGIEQFSHSVSDYFKIAKKYNFRLLNMEELADQSDASFNPYVLGLVFMKNAYKI